jgi:hypothetical protein
MYVYPSVPYQYLSAPATPSNPALPRWRQTFEGIGEAIRWNPRTSRIAHITEIDIPMYAQVYTWANRMGNTDD